jgi:pimeloyl-ACP methyl ester carboxylesterase
MLARLLRTILLAQAGSGALLGGWLCASDRSGPWAMVWLALLVPLGILVLQCSINALRARSKAPALLQWQAWAGEISAAIRLFVLRQPWARKAPEPLLHTAQSPRIPVLLVHGFICNHRVWDLMVPPLRAQGHSVLAIDLEPLFTSIDDYAAPIEQAVQRLRACTGCDQVALLGHSMGGLAIRAWLRRYGTQHVAGIVTLSTPHWGTQARQAMPTPNGLQMQWQSPWLQALNTDEPDAARARMRIALSAQDPVVFPQRAQTLDGVVPHLFVGIGHLQMCTSGKVLQWTLAELALL